MSHHTPRRPLGDDSGNRMVVNNTPTQEEHASVHSTPKNDDSPDPKPSPFASTLRKQHSDLSEQSIRDLNRHKVTRELSESVFKRWKTDTSLTGNFNIDNIADHPDLVESVSSCSTNSLLGLHSRQNSDEITGGPTCSLAIIQQSDGSPTKRRPLLQLRIPSVARRPSTHFHDGGSSLPESFGLDGHSSSPKTQHSVSFHERVQEAIPDDAALELSNGEVDTLLENLMTLHQVEYERDIQQIENEKMSRQSSLSRKSGGRRKAAKEGGSPATEEIVRMDFPETSSYGNYKPRQYGTSHGHSGNASSASSPGSAQTPSSPSENHGHPFYEISPITSMLDKTGYGNSEDIIREIADRLLQVGWQRNRSSSAPAIAPSMPTVGILGRSSTCVEEPSGASFGCIFHVQLPALSYSAPLTRLGRPLLPEGIPTDQYTVLATYHPSYRNMQFDVMNYCYTPAGFESSMIVDLIYLQRCEYLPPHCVWPIHAFSEERYQVATQWSLCTTSRNGHDILCASGLDVLVQRIAGCMFRIHECRDMSRSGHRRYLDSISEGCADVCEVELNSEISELAREPVFTTVSVDYLKSAVLDWMPLNSSPESRLPHSRKKMPIRKF